jgi:hypothetical protein
LPLEVDEEEPKVHLVATPTPISEVDYIKRLIDEHREELDAHIAKMVAGEETDPFLLVLTPDKELKLLRTGNADRVLRTWMAECSVVSTGRSVDYRRVQAYCSAVGLVGDNYVLRRVLSYEGSTPAQSSNWRWIVAASLPKLRALSLRMR